MRVNGKNFRTVWMEKRIVKVIDQNKLPFEFTIFDSKNHSTTANAIKTMIVRGAGAIGATAGYGIAQAFLEAPKENLWNYVEKAKQTLASTRPTTQNLFYAIERVFDSAKNSDNPVETAVREAQRIADEDAESCRTIGIHGEKLIKNNFKIETHCNAGWLAFVDWGSALSPIYTAHRNKKNIFVFVDETRPRGQGARLTAWELKNEKIPHTIIPDNAGAYFMSKGKIDLMIVGADRIAMNGDVANKIGTLEKAIVAKEFGIPFYVAAPTSTFDVKCRTGKDILIEERGEEEVLYQTGPTKENKIETILVASPGSSAKNPAFDITPAKYIAGIITEKSIVKPSEKNIIKLLKHKKQ